MAEVEQFCADLASGGIDAGPAVQPSRLHGDLWSGNVLWGGDGRVWLIDPAAHGGHPSSDLAMLALFGAPCLHEIAESHAAASGIPVLRGPLLALHQLWPLLVHAALFGSVYRPQVLAALRSAGGLLG
jgi:fructosamine-3-kinase